MTNTTPTTNMSGATLPTQPIKGSVIVLRCHSSVGLKVVDDTGTLAYFYSHQFEDATLYCRRLLEAHYSSTNDSLHLATT